MEKMSLPTGLLSLTVAEHRQIYGHTRMATFLTHASADAHVGSHSSGTPRSLCRLPVKWNSTMSSSGISEMRSTPSRGSLDVFRNSGDQAAT